jgi:hypothetical protein
MLVSIDDLTGYDIVAIDGEIGSIRGIFFDDNSWKVRYLILDTGTWLPGRKVGISPQSFNRLDHEEKNFTFHLPRKKSRPARK